MFRTALAISVLASIFVPLGAFAQSAATSHLPVLDVTSMDTSVDPCTDFFTYSCRGWLKNNPIPPDRTSWGVTNKLWEDNKLLLRGILEEAAADGPGREPVKQKIGDYYSSCMDEKAIETAGASPLKDGMDRIVRMRSKRDIAKVVASMPGLNVPFDFQSDQDYKNSSEVIAAVDQGGLGLPDRDYYLKTDAKSVELRQAYVAHVQKMLELLGDAPGTAASEAQTVLRIETALANGSLTQVERRDPKSR
jgi:putative endopeptidase